MGNFSKLYPEKAESSKETAAMVEVFMKWQNDRYWQRAENAITLQLLKIDQYIFWCIFRARAETIISNQWEWTVKYVYICSFKNDILKFGINSEWNVTTYSLLMYTLRCLNYFHSLLLVTCCARDTEKMLHHSQSSRTLNPIFLINDWTRGVRVYWYLR